MDDQVTDNTQIETTEVEKKEDEVRSIHHVKDKKRSKEEKARRKDERRITEQCFKGLNDVHSLEEKLEVMGKKYSEMVDENRKLQLGLKQSEKKATMLHREKEQLQTERSKAVLTRQKLETLCRELQKQNKAVKEESLLKIRGEEERRKEVSAKFQVTLAEITTLMNQNIEKNAKIHEDNADICKKFKTVYKEVEIKEQELLQLHQQMKLDLQFTHAKLASVKMEATAEKEALLKEKQQLLFKLAEYQVQIRELQATEIALRSQVSMYTDKYDEFQNALSRSNKVYGEFNEEMEKMSKKILTLEKETSLWKQRWENSHAALLEMAADKQVRDTEMAKLSKKLSLLKDLCKVFQHERTTLLAKLKEKNGEGQPEAVAKSVNSTATDVSPQSAVAHIEANENMETIETADELSNDLMLPDTFGELQASLSKASEAIQKGFEKDSDNTVIMQEMEHVETANKDNISESQPENNKTAVTEPDVTEKEALSVQDDANTELEKNAERKLDELKEALLIRQRTEEVNDEVNKLDVNIDQKNDFNDTENHLTTRLDHNDEECRQAKGEILEAPHVSNSVKEESDPLVVDIENQNMDPEIKLSTVDSVASSTSEKLSEDTEYYKMSESVHPDGNINIEDGCNGTMLREVDNQCTSEVQDSAIDVVQNDIVQENAETSPNIVNEDTKLDSRLEDIQIDTNNTINRLSEELSEDKVENSMITEFPNVDADLPKEPIHNDRSVPIELNNSDTFIESKNTIVSETDISCSKKEDDCPQDDSVSPNLERTNDCSMETKCSNSSSTKTGKRKKK